MQSLQALNQAEHALCCFKIQPMAMSDNHQRPWKPSRDSPNFALAFFSTSPWMNLSPSFGFFFFFFFKF
ncbi:hypothetical protein EUGRSUZ_D02176 [Eucalyptus grandis]|uniref:Uncharacterized protein n=2 Tax=Eucalyptus grandis TaxID=71139 RepID=A0A059CIE8_EUCGR|nr:hypothetical protein EUGRSUZ_D02176 [Eucalyptus grandis]